jgi:hypothetical protein
VQCPQCKSTEVARSQAVWEQGHHDSSGSTVGVGVTNHGGVGLGVAQTSGVMTSIAARKNAPPTPSRAPNTMGTVAWMAVWIGGYAFCHWSGVWWQAPLMGLVAGLFVAAKMRQDREPQERAKREAYAKRWYCKTCGFQFVP